MSWQLTIPCKRSEAETLGEDWDFLASMEPPPSLVSEEVEAFNNDKWQIVAYFETRPSKASIAALQSKLPSAQKIKPKLKQLPDADWLLMSQQELKPAQAGRFYIHTPDNAEEIPKDSVSFVIPASQAFGTGGHETTAGCLAMLDAIKASGKSYRNIADIGTGTGLLAFAASHLWPRAKVIASDIDPVSIEVTRRNADDNNIRLGRSAGEILAVTAAGTDHASIRQRAPYDLLIANILAGPLIELAPSFAATIKADGTLLLAGLLKSQANRVVEAYARYGFRLQKRRDTGDWPCLQMRLRQKYGYRRKLRSTGRTSQPEGDTGEW